MPWNSLPLQCTHLKLISTCAFQPFSLQTECQINLVYFIYIYIHDTVKSDHTIMLNCMLKRDNWRCRTYSAPFTALIQSEWFKKSSLVGLYGRTIFSECLFRLLSTRISDVGELQECAQENAQFISFFPLKNDDPPLHSQGNTLSPNSTFCCCSWETFSQVHCSWS